MMERPLLKRAQMIMPRLKMSLKTVHVEVVWISGAVNNVNKQK
jgi:hypothetical protein